MEKKIKFEDIIAFIKKAMDKNYKITIKYYPKGLQMFNNISIIKKISEYEYNNQYFSWIQEEDKLYINIEYGYNRQISDYVITVENRKDILKWETLVEEVIDYYHSKVEEDFENFFEEEDSHPKNIDDLDDKDD